MAKITLTIRPLKEQSFDYIEHIIHLCLTCEGTGISPLAEIWEGAKPCPTCEGYGHYRMAVVEGVLYVSAWAYGILKKYR